MRSIESSTVNKDRSVRRRHALPELSSRHPHDRHFHPVKVLLDDCCKFGKCFDVAIRGQYYLHLLPVNLKANRQLRLNLKFLRGLVVLQGLLKVIFE